MENKIGIIGGSGIYQIDGGDILKEHKVETPFGPPSDLIFEVEIEGVTCFFLPRHGRNHHLLPSEINSCANIFALKKLGVRYLVSVSAVGSLKEKIYPRNFVIPHQFIDWTKGLRRKTFFGEGLVGHVSNSIPVDIKLSQIVGQCCEKLNITHHFGGAYICIEGPQFSSVAESNIYRNLGADVVGMTNLPEAYLAKEAGLQYSTLGMVTDFDAWREKTPFDIIMENMRHNTLVAKKLIVSLIKEINDNPPPVQKENLTSILTSPTFWSKKHKEILEILLR